MKPIVVSDAVRMAILMEWEATRFASENSSVKRIGEKYGLNFETVRRIVNRERQIAVLGDPARVHRR